MPKFVKPSGIVLEINENAIEYVKTLGWKEYKKPKPKAKPKKAKDNG